MKITVPFIYEALIIKPRCSKPSLAIIKDSVEVEIKELALTSLPVAMRVGFAEYRWDGSRLFDFDYERVSRKEDRKIRIDEVIKNTESGGTTYKYSCAGAAAPFNNFWRDGVSETMMSKHGVRLHGMRTQLGDKKVITLDNAIYRTWIDDNRAAVINKAKEIASNLLIVDGFMFCPVGEPRYVINTFGMGNNHGGTAMFIDNSYNDNIKKQAYFNALEYQEACDYADKVASRRGDNKSIPVRPNGGCVIEVLIPEAVKLNPSIDHGDGCEFINAIENGINNAGAFGSIAAMAGLITQQQ